MTAVDVQSSDSFAQATHAHFSPVMDGILSEASEERLIEAFLNIMTALACVRTETNVFNHMYKSSKVGFGNYSKVNKLSALVHSAQDEIQAELSQVLKVKSDVEEYFKTRSKANHKLPSCDQFDSPDNDFRDCMWSTLLSMRKAYREEHAWETLPRNLSQETRTEFNEVAERYQRLFEGSKTYENASDEERAVYQRFKRVLTDDEETRTKEDFRIKARL